MIQHVACIWYHMQKSWICINPDLKKEKKKKTVVAFFVGKKQSQQLGVKRWLLCLNKKQSAETAWNSRDTMYKSWMHLWNCSIWNKEPQGGIIEHNLWSEASLILHVKAKLRYDWYRFVSYAASHSLTLQQSFWNSPFYKAKGLTT